jgi:hypothetical protein
VKTRRRRATRTLLGPTRLGHPWGEPAPEKRILGMAWYTEQEWGRLREFAHDREVLDESYGDWLRNAEETLADLRSKGVVIEKVPLDVAKAAQWCSKHGRPFTSSERAALAAELLREAHRKKGAVEQADAADEAGAPSRRRRRLRS